MLITYKEASVGCVAGRGWKTQPGDHAVSSLGFSKVLLPVACSFAPFLNRASNINTIPSVLLHPCTHFTSHAQEPRCRESCRAVCSR